MDDFLADIRTQFEAPLEIDRLRAFSAELEAECRDRLRQSSISMLPSYQHALPNGNEVGDYLALDVGGSTFRLALIHLKGKSSGGAEDLQVRHTRKFDINEDIRRLQGEAFFDWMAARIADMLHETQYDPVPHAPLPMGLAWSFPVEQTSPRSGKLLAMGKGFCATLGVEGQDLSDLIMRACSRRSLPVEMRAIVNDGSATLLAKAYRDPSTRMSLILGTGTNASVFLPTAALSRDKFGARPDKWFAAAERVLVNTEMSMLGRHILPTTRWDDELNTRHRLPDFQPLEYLITGRYLGEIVRLIIVDAVASVDLFDGQLPTGLDEAYALDTRLLAAFEADQTTAGLEKAAAAFSQAHPLRSMANASTAAAFSLSSSTHSPILAHNASMGDWSFIRDVTRLVTHRAAAYLATALHALWMVYADAEKSLATANSDDEQAAFATRANVTIACHGTIAEQYPGYRARCQRYLDDMCDGTRAITLALAPDSSILGAAVAVACLERREG